MLRPENGSVRSGPLEDCRVYRQCTLDTGGGNKRRNNDNRVWPLIIVRFTLLFSLLLLFP